MERYLLDANVLVRFFTREPEDKALRAASFLARGERKEAELLLHPLIVAEVAYVLRAHYKYPLSTVEELFLALFSTGAVKVLEKERTLKALGWMKAHNVDFEDAYLAALAEDLGAKLASFDRKAASRVPGLWHEP